MEAEASAPLEPTASVSDGEAAVMQSLGDAVVNVLGPQPAAVDEAGVALQQ